MITDFREIGRNLAISIPNQSIRAFHKMIVGVYGVQFAVMFWMNTGNQLLEFGVSTHLAPAFPSEEQYRSLSASMYNWFPHAMTEE